MNRSALIFLTANFASFHEFFTNSRWSSDELQTHGLTARERKTSEAVLWTSKAVLWTSEALGLPSHSATLRGRYAVVGGSTIDLPSKSSPSAFRGSYGQAKHAAERQCG